MPLEAPQLDSRTFETLKRQALLRIQRYNPEWTDYNESDPGVTLVELFAWLTEMMFYEMNRVPERNYLKFLQLLGLELEQAVPAVAYLKFTADPDARLPPGGDSLTVPERTPIAAQPAGGDPIIFETTAGLNLIRVPLADVQVLDGAGFTIVTTANNTPGTPYRPLGWVPQVGNALYLGFLSPDDSSTAGQAAPQNPAGSPMPGLTLVNAGEPPIAGRVFPQELSFRVFLPLEAQAGRPVNCAGPAAPTPAPPATLSWEYRAAAGLWRQLEVYQDESAGFTREGTILVRGPADIQSTVEGRVKDKRFWLRVRLAAGAYPARHAPEIDFISPNVVAAENLATVRDEFVGTSDGTPGQVFALRFRPVRKQTIRVSIPDETGQAEEWQRRDDFLGSNAAAAHYVLDAARGEIRFGDSRNGRIPAAGAEITVTFYQYGGQAAGNVEAGQINALQTSVPGVAAVVNERPAAGGCDEQSLTDFVRQAPALLRHRNRAVAADDFATLAREVGGIGKAIALPLFHPDYRGVAVPGAITVVVVPANDDLPPRPTPAQLEGVCAYLDERRLLTTELYVKGPEYKAVLVEATVAVEPYAAFDDVARQVGVALNAHLDPLGRGLPADSPLQGCGNGPPPAGPNPLFAGWDFGQDFYPTHLYGVIQAVPCVRQVLRLDVSVNGQLLNNLNDPVRLEADTLIYGVARHEIEVVPYRDL
jgi:hypothetical protein